MAQEVELGRLAVVDPSGVSAEIVLTNLRVYQNKDSGIFGYNVTIIPYSAITTVRVGWRRAFWVLLAGLIVFVLGLFSVVIDVQSLLLSSQLSGSAQAATYLHFVRYLLLLVGAGLLLVFWFWKRSEVQIMAPTVTIAGRPKNHAEGQRFCDLLLSIMHEPVTEGAGEEKEAGATKESAEKEWRL